jgi:hypothetical protein
VRIGFLIIDAHDLCFVIVRDIVHVAQDLIRIIPRDYRAAKARSVPVGRFPSIVERERDRCARIIDRSIDRGGLSAHSERSDRTLLCQLFQTLFKQSLITFISRRSREKERIQAESWNFVISTFYSQ